MFHQGSLQSGIAEAIQQQKLVACFVRDDSETSQAWENDWLKSGWISNLLVQKAVLLRLEGGSTEAGFLAAFCDVSATPNFVVIHNGKLQLQLGKDVGKDEFVNSIRTILGAEALPGATPTSQASTAPAQAEDDLYGTPEPVQPSIQPVAIPARAPAPAPAPVPTSSIAKGKQKATSLSQAELEAEAASANATKQAARDAVRKKKREDAEELARIKARIEQDKAERKAAASARAAERERERTGASTQTKSQPSTSARGSQAQTVSLNVRLFDGKTIRHVFPRTATLQDEVRAWIDAEFEKLEANDPNVNNRALPPFFFRHILPPQPARELSAGDEAQTLGDIDLAPSATLVLVPVKGYTEAYTGGEGVVGTATGLVGGAFGLLSSTVGYVGSALGAVVGFGGGAASDANAQAPGQGRAVGGSEPPPRAGNTQGGEAIRVRTLADQRAREPQTFYNGNQLSTEPRPDDDHRR